MIDPTGERQLEQKFLNNKIKLLRNEPTQNRVAPLFPKNSTKSSTCSRAWDVKDFGVSFMKQEGR